MKKDTYLSKKEWKIIDSKNVKRIKKESLSHFLDIQVNILDSLKAALKKDENNTFISEAVLKKEEEVARLKEDFIKFISNE
ncbi:hypothetical protein SSABA_v1c04670 [Spiroplasma sabaudiense Ar-1343]|uniref:Uncharacterized protein n=1 Tax=Spiroplasma sabaudiense Ar-1343 TaxID=1276257 RepID=W6AJH9_9MOLU|nr:hypothetical protein [Spiroplasma sabaudiense]AHI53874.1 hypothetical protein SSABA_v1c04670 [Spiroplasma sabaudiense Ar-1343]